MNADAENYEFGEFRLEVGKRLLLRRGEAVSLTPKVFETLLQLVRHRGKVIAKDDLMRAVWPDTVVEENNLNQNISALRRVLGESRGEHRYIATIPGKGYHFLASVETAGRRGGAEVTVAVLPFHNLSGDAEREYLADGLTEDVIATLGQVDPEHIRVIGRTTMMAYKQTKKTLAEIGRELGAEYVVESSMRSEAGLVRITSNLIRVTDQVQTWSMSYDSRPNSMLEFQREMRAAIGEQVRRQLSPERMSRLRGGKRRMQMRMTSICAGGISGISCRRQRREERVSFSRAPPSLTRTMRWRGRGWPMGIRRVPSTGTHLR